MHITHWILAFGLFLSSCTAPPLSPEPTKTETELVINQVLDGQEGEIHYSYYLPEGYDEVENYPMMVVMPG